MKTYSHEAGRTEEEGSLNSAQETELQQERPAARAGGLRRGCVRHLQVSLAIGGFPTQAAVPAASDLMPRQVLYSMLLLPLKKYSAKKLGK